MDRGERILKHITKDRKGIEIGPWFAPRAQKGEGYNCEGRPSCGARQTEGHNSVNDDRNRQTGLGRIIKINIS
jgi:hypothetical protein